MPLNLLKKYNELLDLAGYPNDGARKNSLYAIFKRDIEENPGLNFRGKKINPIKGKEPEMQNLFTHLTTSIDDEATRHRSFEIKRSQRLHWIKHHLEEKKIAGMKMFSTEERDGIRTYILDEDETYVIVLAPYRNEQEYYLLTAYYLEGRNFKKLQQKYQRRLPELH